MAMIGAGLGGVTAAEVSRNLAAAEGRGPGLSSIVLDAFNGRGETPSHLLHPAFLQDCHDALAPGGVLLVNVFNGLEGSREREHIARLAALLGGQFDQTFSLPVATQEQSLVLAARRSGGLRRPGRRELAAKKAATS